MATDGYDKHDEYMKLGYELTEACGSIKGERCEQDIEFNRCIEKEVKAKSFNIPFL